MRKPTFGRWRGEGRHVRARGLGPLEQVHRADGGAEDTGQSGFGFRVERVAVRLLSYTLPPALDRMLPLSSSSKSGSFILQAEVHEMRGDSSSGNGFADFIEGLKKWGAP